jgi:hypothetical protein
LKQTCGKKIWSIFHLETAIDQNSFCKWFHLLSGNQTWHWQLPKKYSFMIFPASNLRVAWRFSSHPRLTGSRTTNLDPTRCLQPCCAVWKNHPTKKSQHFTTLGYSNMACWKILFM